MTKILSIDDMLSAAIESSMPEALMFTRAVEAIGTALAHSLAKHLSIGTNFADFQPGCGGTCAPFFPLKPRQKCPHVIDSRDESGEWESPGPYLPKTPDDAPRSMPEAIARIKEEK